MHPTIYNRHKTNTGYTQTTTTPTYINTTTNNHPNTHPPPITPDDKQNPNIKQLLSQLETLTLNDTLNKNTIMNLHHQNAILTQKIKHYENTEKEITNLHEYINYEQTELKKQ